MQNGGAVWAMRRGFLERDPSDFVGEYNLLDELNARGFHISIAHAAIYCQETFYHLICGVGVLL